MRLFSSSSYGHGLVLALFVICVFTAALAQDANHNPATDNSATADPSSATSSQSSAVPEAARQDPEPTKQDPLSESLVGKQTKRILGIIPNFRSVSVDEKLPPQSVKDKFIESTEDSFDYSAFIFAGLLAGIAQAENSFPEFHQGAAGYGRYYWHTFADQADENYQVEFFFPIALRQDPRYYTLGRGGLVKRAAYSFSRVLITRTDSGRETFNSSEIVGAGAAAGISNFYYPSAERTWTKTGQRWLLNVGLDSVTFVFKEFWPDINSKIFHEKF
jgi:hypothetical protein